MPNLSSPTLVAASAGLVGAAALSTMGLFGRNHFPVEGKVLTPSSAVPGLAFVQS